MAPAFLPSAIWCNRFRQLQFASGVAIPCRVQGRSKTLKGYCARWLGNPVSVGRRLMSVAGVVWAELPLVFSLKLSLGYFPKPEMVGFELLTGAV